jgi:hypothetical protein
MYSLVAAALLLALGRCDYRANAFGAAALI